MPECFVCIELINKTLYVLLVIRQMEIDVRQKVRDCGFEIFFAVGVLETQEVEEVRVPEDEVRSQLVFLSRGFQFMFDKYTAIPLISFCSG